MRLLQFALLAATLSLPLPAIAGDAATPNVLGFSADGSIFAFEEYGVQDGSGFSYANRFYIDTKTDRFVEASPIRVTLEDESAAPPEARTRARQLGEAIVPQAVLDANPGFTAGWNALTERSADPSRIVVLPRPVFPAIDPPVEFRLVEIPFASPSGCADFGDTVGFRLLRIDPTPGGATTVVHEDKAVPAGRRCPLGYAIGGVQTFYPGSGGPVFAVMVAVRSVGFEGPDHRWIAVTGRL